MNLMLVLGFLAVIGLVCLVGCGVPAAIINAIQGVYRHEKMMRPQNVYFIGR